MGQILGAAAEKLILTKMKPECDIILLSYESPALLKKCVLSVLECTRPKSRLIIVDNASKDPEVGRFIQDVQGNDAVSVVKVFSEENLGFAAGMNRGMKISDAPLVCLLNNDCIVTPGWLEEMMAVARSSDEVGLVNPQSNTFGSRPDGKASINEHATLLSDKKGRYVELGHAIGFACLIKREVIEKVGYLEEAYKGVCYEDTDFSIRSQRKGFISVMAEGAYVFHTEQASRKNLKEKEEVYRRNKEIFEERWGSLLRVFFLDATAGAGTATEKNYELLKGLARERTIVDFWVRQKREKKEPFFGYEKRGITKHADIGLKVRTGPFLSLAALWKILTKKKKYNAVILGKGLLVRMLQLLAPLRGMQAFSTEGRWIRRNDQVFDLGKPSEFAEYLRRKQ